MPTYQHPGVYVEEVSGGARPIEGVATSVAAFVGTARRGSPNEAVLIHGFEDYLALYGTRNSQGDVMELSVGAFYQNGGRDAYIMRVAHHGEPSFLPLVSPNETNVLTISATTEGEWGGDLYIRVTRPGPLTFTLEVGHEEIRDDGSKYYQPDKTFADLTMNERDDHYAVNVVRDGSKLVELKLNKDAPQVVKGELTGAKVPRVTDTPANDNKYFFEFIKNYKLDDHFDLVLKIDDREAKKVTITKAELLKTDLRDPSMGVKGSSYQDDARVIAGFITKKLPMEDPYHGLTVTYTIDRFVLTSPTLTTDSSVYVFDGDLAKALAIDPVSATSSPASAPFLPKWLNWTKLNNNAATTTPDKSDITDAFTKLQKVRDVSIIVLPVDRDKNIYNDFVAAAVSHCDATKSRVVLIDPPPGTPGKSGELLQKSDVDILQLTTSTYAVCYYPWVKVSNPRYNSEVDPPDKATVLVAPSAFAAGIWSRTDGTRGVWKAPAGVEASLSGAVDLQYDVGDEQQDQLNPLGINCFRRLPTFGPVVWGARTLATKANPEWRYVPVRRTAILIEQSVYNGIQWAVFEPNDHRLWSSLRANIGSFMDGLYRAGAFQGEKASDAYFVRCGLGDTMTQGDIDRGQVIAVVGFAPLKPAEFVIVRIQQMLQQ